MARSDGSCPGQTTSGDAAQTVTVTGLDDKVADTDTAYKLVIGPATSTDSGYAGLDPADLEIVNKANGSVPPAVPTLTVASISVPEGTDVKRDVTLVFTLSAPSAETVSVGYATSDDTAIAPDDYIGAEGIVTFKPGERKVTLNLTVIGDAESENDESFVVKLFDPKAATLAQDFVTVTILNDD